MLNMKMPLFLVFSLIHLGLRLCQEQQSSQIFLLLGKTDEIERLFKGAWSKVVEHGPQPLYRAKLGKTKQAMELI